MHRARYVLPLALIALLVSGCFRIEQEIDLTDGGPEAYVTTRLEVDKTFAGAEMDLFLESLALSAPGLTTQARHERYEVSADFGSTVVYVWEGREKVRGDFMIRRRDDGTYELRYPVRIAGSFSDDTDSSSVLLKITVKMPKEIDLANTTKIDGNTAVWELTKTDLARGVILRAITVE